MADSTSTRPGNVATHEETLRPGAALKSRSEIECMRAAGRVVREVLRQTGRAVAPGVTTADLEEIAVGIILERGGTSPFLDYAPAGHPPYPAWTCISVNDEIVHGIPGSRVLSEGDVVSVDCGVELDGWVADSAWTFPVGKASPEAERLMRVTEMALYKGIAAARPGRHMSDIGAAIQRHVERHGYSVVRELMGHGVGRSMHEGDLQVLNYGRPGQGRALEIGMTFAIEPMVNAGKRDIRCLPDQWTIATADGSLSAHFEHTVAIVRGGADVLT